MKLKATFLEVIEIVKRRLRVYHRWTKQKIINKNFAEGVAFVLTMILIIGLVITAIATIISLPFAFIGWAVLTTINIFLSITITYFNAFMVGVVVVLVGSRWIR